MVSTGTFVVPETLTTSPEQTLSLSFVSSGVKNPQYVKFEKDQVLAMNQALRRSIAEIKTVEISEFGETEENRSHEPTVDSPSEYDEDESH